MKHILKSKNLNSPFTFLFAYIAICVLVVACGVSTTPDENKHNYKQEMQQEHDSAMKALQDSLDSLPNDARIGIQIGLMFNEIQGIK